MTPQPARERFFHRRRRVITGAVISALAVAVIGLVVAALREVSPPPKLQQRRLTANRPDHPITRAAISPDGNYLAYSDQTGTYLQALSNGNTRRLSFPQVAHATEGSWEFASWYPDAQRFTARVAIIGQPVSLWAVGLDGSGRELLSDVYGGAAVSPDGGHIAFLRRPVFLDNNLGDPYTIGAREIWMMGPHGESPNQIASSCDACGFERLVWEPSGERLAYKHWDKSNDNVRVSIRSVGLDGGADSVLLTEIRLEDFAFTSAGALIYSRRDESDSSDYPADNLWELKTDATSGIPLAAPRRLTRWSGFLATEMTYAPRAHLLALLRGSRHHTIFIGDIAAGGATVLNTRPLTWDDHSNIPLDWSPDSQEVIFISRRNQVQQVFAQALDQPTPRVITRDLDLNFLNARRAAEGGDLLALAGPKESNTPVFYRLPLGGGVPKLLFDPGPISDWDFRCSHRTANVCTYADRNADGTSFIIRLLQPQSRRGKELIRIPVKAGADYHWSISPDGSQIGILKSEWGSDEIRLFSLTGLPAKTIRLRGYGELRSIDWLPDAKSLLIGTSGPDGSAVLRVEMDGTAQMLWHQSQPLNTWAVPSPDGRHVAIFGTSTDANAWTVSGL